MKTYILATKNRKKCQEMARILEPLGISVKTSEDAGFGELPEVDETGATYEENAELKAAHRFEKNIYSRNLCRAPLARS